MDSKANGKGTYFHINGAKYEGEVNISLKLSGQMISSMVTVKRFGLIQLNTLDNLGRVKKTDKENWNSLTDQLMKVRVEFYLNRQFL